MSHHLKLITSGLAAMVFMFPTAESKETPASTGGAAKSASSSDTEIVNLSPYFKGFSGTFVLLDTKTGKTIKYNPVAAAKMMPAQSTFKIFTALAGLDSGVLKGKDDLQKWDGVTRELAPWNKDQTLQTAMRDSVVWYFQDVARRIGAERMDKYLKENQYGNMDMSGGLTTFWLDSTLKISPDQQVEFLRKLDKRELHFSEKAMNTTAELIELKKTPLGVLSGKTGTKGDAKHNVFGWFVGYVKHDGNTYVFATNIQAKDGALGRKARAITEAILHQRGLL